VGGHILRDVAVSLIVLGYAAGVSTPKEGAAIHGQVVDDLGAPVSQALVALENDGGRTAWNGFTNEDGTFSLSNIRRGRYTLIATSATHPQGRFGMVPGVAAGVEIMLADSDIVTGLSVRLLRGGAVAGNVQLPSGEPAQSTEVVAFSPSVSREAQPVFSTTTDEQGRYRIFGIPTGTYLVAAILLQPPVIGESDAARTITAPTLYGDVTDWHAALRVDVVPGATATAAIRLQTIRVGTVTGVIQGASPVRAKSYRIQAIPEADAPKWWLDASSRQIVNGEVGTFVFSDLGPGAYRLVARRIGSAVAPSDPEALATFRVVTDAARAVTTELQLHAGLVFQGAINCNAGGQRIGPPREVIATDSSAVSSVRGTAVVSPSGGFRIDGLMPGRYQLAAGPSPVGTSRVLVSGTEFVLVDESVTDAVVRCSDQPTTLRGVLTQATGAPLSGVLLVAVTTQEASGANPALARIVRPDANGRYELTDLQSGDYIVAVANAADYQRDGASVVAAVRTSGLAVHLADGEQRTLDLRSSTNDTKTTAVTATVGPALCARTRILPLYVAGTNYLRLTA